MANLQPKENFLKYREMDIAISKMFEAQRLMRSKQYDHAITILQDLEKNQPHLSIIAELIGSGHYIKKDFEAALDAYNKAYQVNPENKEAFKMKKYLERALRVQNSRGDR
jgi:tetratricopeptide (TPR) repeat protein